MADITSVVSGARQAIGWYFGVVSVLPSILFTVYVFLLVASGSWMGSPHWGKALAQMRDLGLGGAVLLGIAGVTLALILHPLQFSMAQLMEGYWGTGRIAQRVRVTRIRHYHQDSKRLESRTADALEKIADWNIGQGMDLKIRLLSQKDEASRAALNYPPEPELIMPTRLGNVLRRYEVLAGRPYELNAPVILPHLALIAPAEHRDYLNDQRSAMDLAIRITLTSALAFVVTVLFLWHSGLWLLVALIPYLLTYLGYRGSIVAAQSYGIAMSATIALNRFSLYDSLRVPQSETTVQEQTRNQMLMHLLQGEEGATMAYHHPPPPAGP